MDKLTISLVFGLLASFFFALNNTFERKGREFMNSITFSLGKVMSNVILLILMIIPLAFFGFIKVNFNELIKFSIDNWVYNLLGILSFGLAYTLFVYLLTKDYIIKIVSLVNFLVAILSVLIGVFFFKDNLSIFVLFGAFLILIGLLFLNELEINYLKKLKPLDVLFLAIVVITFTYFPFYTTIYSKAFDPFIGVFMGEFITLISVLIYLFIFKFIVKNKKFSEMFKFEFEKLKKGIKYVILSSIVLIFSFVFLLYGASNGYYSLTLVLSYLSVLWLAVIAHFYLKERLKKVQYFGALLIAIGLILIKLFSGL
jgi:drug/metabolite transporter (DMT)-like permease